MLANWEWRQCFKRRSPVALSSLVAITIHLRFLLNAEQERRSWWCDWHNCFCTEQNHPDKCWRETANLRLEGMQGRIKETFFFLSEMSNLFILLLNPPAHWNNDRLKEGQTYHSLFPRVSYIWVIKKGHICHTCECFNWKDRFWNSRISALKKVNEWEFCSLSVTELLNRVILSNPSSGE